MWAEPKGSPYPDFTEVAKEKALSEASRVLPTRIKRVDAALTRLRGLACFSKVGSIQIKWLGKGQKVFTTERERTDSDGAGFSPRNLKWETIRG